MRAQRTQITLDSEVQRRARQKAAALGISFAEYVRQLVARDLECLEREVVSVGSVFDLGDSGGTDIGRDKDRMVAQAFADDRRDSLGGSRAVREGLVGEL